MVDFMSELETAAPDSEIFLMTIPPVTAAHEEKGIETMENINAFNALLRQTAAENSYNLIDFGVTLKDSTGYFAEDYAEADGLHFKPAAYVKMLDYIQDAIINEDFVFIPD
jgi:lysophospholipase L1-like esterase